MEHEAAPPLIPAGRTRKPKSGAERQPRKSKVAIAITEGPDLIPEPNDPDERVYGYKVKDGFARIMVFADPSEGNKVCFFEVKLGDHPRTFLAKNKLHVLPMGLVNIITDTTNEFPVDDLSDEAHPTRGSEMRARFPHSEPIPATKDEYIVYRRTQDPLPHPNKYKKSN